MHSPVEPTYATRPYPGLRPKIPQYPDGIRILPPTSEPTPRAAPSAASSAPSPPEDPPEVCAADHGLHVRPQRGLQLSNARSVCGMFVLVIIMAPAARSVETSYILWAGARKSSLREWKGKVGRVGMGRRTAASCSAGLLAHCVYPIVLSNPFTLTILPPSRQPS